MKTRIKLAKWAQPLFKKNRYKVLYGGRGSGKSYAVAIALLILGAQKPLRILCAREFQNSIKDSSLKLLCDQIDSYPQLKNHYTYTQTGIVGKNGTEFIFKGVKTNTESIKSMAGINILWLEEAQTISQSSWDILIPTIRESGSEIWATFNPLNEDDPTYTMFVDKFGNPNGRPDTYCVKVNWRDNPWFPEELRKEKDYMFETDPEKAMHVWEGECRTNSDAQIFKGKWEVRDFEVNKSWDGPYFGADFGFSVDPSTLIKMYLDTHERILYISEEFYGYGVEIDDLPKKYDTVSESRTRPIRGDSARPETISYIARQRFMMMAAQKWQGSVEDGIEWIRSLRKVVIHTRCPNTAMEFRKYSYKVDRLTGDITTIVVDANNHAIDAIRYGLEPLITAGKLGILSVL